MPQITPDDYVSLTVGRNHIPHKCIEDLIDKSGWVEHVIIKSHMQIMAPRILQYVEWCEQLEMTAMKNTIRNELDLDKHTVIAGAVHQHNNHWCLYYVNLKTNEFSFFDTSYTPKNKRSVQLKQDEEEIMYCKWK